MAIYSHTTVLDALRAAAKAAQSARDAATAASAALASERATAPGATVSPPNETGGAGAEHHRAT